MTRTVNIHATGLLLGTTGVLLRGPSGAGKSVLALSLLDRWEGRGEPALLISDDRVDIGRTETGLEMRAPKSLAGLIELRGRGIVRRPHAEQAPLDLVVDLVPEFIRILEEDVMSTEIQGVTLPRCPVPRAGSIALGHQVLLVVEAISSLTVLR